MSKLSELSQIEVWQICMTDINLKVFKLSTYYLRYDIRREKYIRLSPSILRDFMSFTYISLAEHQDLAAAEHVQLANTHRQISLHKIAIARKIMLEVFGVFPLAQREKLCAFVAGDLAYFLGHNVPREQAVSGRMVAGSDIDIVFVQDGWADADVKKLEDIVSRNKYYYLKHPDHRQEVDFICKSVDTMCDQFTYGDIHEKIASKIAYEGQFLGGSVALFQYIQDQMTMRGARAKIEADFQIAVDDRSRAVTELLKFDGRALDPDTESLFYFSQERIEFS